MRTKPLALAIGQVLAAACTAGLAAQAVAQEPDDAHRLEEVIVTARKVEENLQETPIAITAFSGNMLQDRQVFTTDVLDQIVPNLQFANNAPLAGNNSSSAVFIRGIGQTDPTSTVDPGVGLYIDDVYIGNAVGGTMALRDVASIQVLRGPQGTLFGRNTIGGAVLITTNEPGDEFGGTVRAGVGTDDLLDALVAVDLPFSDTFKTRTSIGLRRQDGYVIRPDGTDLGDTDQVMFNTKWVWRPSERTSATLNFDYTKADENGAPLVFAAMNENAAFPRVSSLEAGCPGLSDGAVPPPGLPDQPAVPMIADPRCANDFQARGPYSNSGTLPLYSTLRGAGVSLRLAFDLTDTLQFKSISSYRTIKWTGARDADNTPLTILHTEYDVDGDQRSQEFQLTYESEPFIGVIGLYYFAQTSDDIATIALNPPPPGVQRDSDNNKVDNESWAAFTQWTWKFADRYSLTVGGRYTEDEKGSYPDQFDYASPTVKQVPVQWYTDTFTSLTPSASLAVQWTESAMAYLSYSEGFKGGGWNSHFNAVLTAPQQEALQKFDQEEAQTIEAGLKLDLADDSLRLNFAAFTSDYTNMQLTYRGPAPAGVAPFITNAGETSIDGAEIELTWAPAEAWRIEGSVGYLDATIDSLENIPLAVLPPDLVEGNFLPYAPEWQAHLGLSYAATVGGLRVEPRIDGSFETTKYFDATNTREIAQLEDITTVNASLRLSRGEDSPWRLTLGLNNATDEIYPVAGNSSLTTGSGYAEIAYARPREWFATLQYEF